jgi:hypothetical protein
MQSSYRLNDNLNGNFDCTFDIDPDVLWKSAMWDGEITTF